MLLSDLKQISTGLVHRQPVFLCPTCQSHSSQGRSKTMYKVQFFENDQWHDLTGYPNMTLELARQCWMDYTYTFKDAEAYRIEKVD